MELEFSVTDVTTLPSEVASLYKRTESGVYELNVKGAVAEAKFTELKTKLDEFRDNNRELFKKTQKLDQFETVFKGADLSPEKLNQHIEEQVLSRAGELKTAYESQLTEVNNKNAALQAQLEQIVLSDAVAQKSIKHGVVDTAVEDVLARAKQAFKVVDGVLVASDASLGADGKPKTLDGWFGSLSTSSPHLFTQNKGVGVVKPLKATPGEGRLSPAERIAKGLAAKR